MDEQERGKKEAMIVPNLILFLSFVLSFCFVFVSCLRRRQSNLSIYSPEASLHTKTSLSLPSIHPTPLVIQQILLKIKINLKKKKKYFTENRSRPQGGKSHGNIFFFFFFKWN